MCQISIAISNNPIVGMFIGGLFVLIIMIIFVLKRRNMPQKDGIESVVWIAKAIAGWSPRPVRDERVGLIPKFILTS